MFAAEWRRAKVAVFVKGVLKFNPVGPSFASYKSLSEGVVNGLVIYLLPPS